VADMKMLDPKALYCWMGMLSQGVQCELFLEVSLTEYSISLRTTHVQV
jgi:hypothetical protein